MRESKASNVQKVQLLTLKLFSTLLLWIATAILAKFQLARNAKDWQQTFEQIPLWVLVTMIVFLPLFWLFVEFAITLFFEVRILLIEAAAPKTARLAAQIPSAAKEVLCRWWDSCLACLDRWRFDGRYERRLAEDCAQLHTQTGLLHATADFSLDRVYTELNIASTQYGEVNPKLLASSIRGRESIYSFLRVQQPGTSLAVLGRPGSGKTTLLRHLTLIYSRNAQADRRLRRRIPILIELRRLTGLFTDKPPSKWRSPSLIDVVLYYWKHYSALEELMDHAPKDWLKRRLASGRILIMVDGLDEVPHIRNDSRSNGETPRERVSRWIEHEMQREGQRNCLFVVTSRPGGFSEAPLQFRTTVLEIQPLTSEQTRAFIYSFQLGCQCKEHPSESRKQNELLATKATIRLVSDLRNKHHIAPLATNPLLLHMLCLIKHLRGRLAVDRSDLYEETCDILINRDLRASGIQERLRPLDKLAALRSLANYFMRSESPEAKSTEELLCVLRPEFDTLDFPVEEFLDYAAADTGLIHESERDRWDFAHKSFYEYLAAEYWEKHLIKMDELNEWVERDWWRVSLLFYSAKSDDSPVIAAGLRRETIKALSLAFECFSAGHRLNSIVRGDLNRRLDTVLRNPSIEPSFVTGALALLDLRNRQTVAVSGEAIVIRREILITQAEYQAFLLSQRPEFRPRLIPLHWRNAQFEGDPLAPILGVTPFQAWSFAAWASTLSDYTWSLPNTPPLNYVAPQCYWCGSQLLLDVGVISGATAKLNSDFLGCLPTHSSDFGIKGFANALSSEFFQWKDERKQRVFRKLLLNRKFGSHQWERFGRIGFSIVKMIEICRIISVGGIPGDANALFPIISWQSKPTSEALVPYYEAVGLAFADSLGVYGERAAVFLRFLRSDRGLSETIDEIEKYIDDITPNFYYMFCERPYPRREELSGQGIARDFEDGKLPPFTPRDLSKVVPLLRALAAIISSRKEPLKHKVAYLSLGLILCEICIPCLSEDCLEEMKWKHYVLSILQMKERGNLPPWEGIQLVSEP